MDKENPQENILTSRKTRWAKLVKALRLNQFSAEKKKLTESFISLSTLQAANYILPFITFPYLYRVLGVEKVGLIAFAQASVQYFVLLTDYGFNLSATGKISINRDNKEKVSQIFSSVITIKFLLLLVSFLVMLLFVFTIPKFRADSLVYIYTFGIVVGSVLFPVWFFQGMEKMRYIALLNLLAKLLFTVAVFVLVRSQTDYLLVPVTNSIGFIVAGVLSLWVAYKNFDIDIKVPGISWIIEELRDGWHVFISTGAVSLYTASNTFMLGLFTNNAIVGYYSAGEKIVRALQGLMMPVSQTIYPHINRLYDESRERSLQFIRKALMGVAGFTFLISATTFIFAGPLVSVVFGTQGEESIIIAKVVRILAFLPFIVGLSNIYGIQTMLTFGMKDVFSRILIYGGLTNIILVMILTPLYKHIGTAVAVMITELTITTAMYLYLERNGVKILKGVLTR